MRIYLGADHRGFELKERAKSFLAEQGYDVEDLGAVVFDPHDDYPVYVHAVAQAVAQGEGARGVVLCGSAVGASIVANKVKGAWAAVVWTEELAKLSREHNNSNVLVLPADSLSPVQVVRFLHVWLATPFSRAARHERRLRELEAYEDQHFR